jgi:hypothetical protein
LGSISGTGLGSPTQAAISSAAANVQIHNASTEQFGQPSVGPVQPEDTNWTTNQYASSYFGTNQQFWRPGSTIFQPGSLDAMTQRRLDGMMLHELLHNLGYSDADLQKSLGLTVTLLDTDNISRELSKQCFK